MDLKITSKITKKWPKSLIIIGGNLSVFDFSRVGGPNSIFGQFWWIWGIILVLLEGVEGVFWWLGGHDAVNYLLSLNLSASTLKS